MERGYLHTVVCIVLLTVLGLLGLKWLPQLSVGGMTLRQVDILSDISNDSTGMPAQTDTIKELPVVKNAINTCKPGMTCINDMSGDERQGIEPLYEAIEQMASLGRPVRIAVLGDSFIEGDILTEPLREQLQTLYGGCGVGYVPITSNVNGFRRSVRHNFSGWTEHNGNDHRGFGGEHASITGHYYAATPGANVELRGTTATAHLDTCQVATLYYTGYGTASVTATVNGTATQRFNISGNGEVGSVHVNGKIGSVKWTVDYSDPGIAFLGSAMDGNDGITVDNFSLRSSCGYHLGKVSDRMFASFDKARHYDLVIIMYGLNIAHKGQKQFNEYSMKMGSAIDRMKQAMPTTGFLVVSVSDRAQRTTSGALNTMSCITALINVQQQLAFDHHIAFWNMFTAMGGSGSIVRMAQAKPAEANRDYTHINFNGGKRIGRIFAETLDWGYQSYHQQNTPKGGEQ